MIIYQAESSSKSYSKEFTKISLRYVVRRTYCLSATFDLHLAAGSVRPRPLYHTCRGEQLPNATGLLWCSWQEGSRQKCRGGSRQEYRGNLFIATFKCHYVVHSYMSRLCFIPYWTLIWCSRQAGSRQECREGSRQECPW